MIAENESPQAPESWADEAASLRSARRHLLAFFLLAGLLVMAGYAYVSHTQAEAQAQVHRELSVIADLKQRQISNWREERLADAQFFAQARFVAHDLELLLSEPESAPIRSNVLHWLTLLKSGNRYEAAIVFDASLKERLAITTPPTSALALQGLASMQEALRTRKIVMSDLHRDGTNESIHLEIALPIFENADTNAGAPLGLIVLKLEAGQFLFPLIQIWPTPTDTAETLLVRKDGDHVLYLNELRHRRNTALALRIPLSRADLPAARTLSGDIEVTEGIDYRGVPTVATGRLIPGTTWGMVAKIDKEEAYAPLQQEKFLALAVIAALLLAGAMLVLMLWKLRSARFIKEQLSQREDHERAMQRMNRLYSTLSHANGAVVRARSQEDLLQKICNALVQHGGFSMAWIGYVEKDGSRVTQVAQCGDDRYLRKVELFANHNAAGRDPIITAVREGRACISNDVSRDPTLELWREVLSQAQVGSLAAFPIRQEGQVTAALVVYAQEKGFFGPEEQALMEEAANDVSFGLDILLNDQRRRVAEEQARLQVAALQSAANAIVITDRKGVIQWANTAFERLTGFSATDAIGKTPRIIKSDQQPSAFFKHMWDTILLGQVWRGELINRRKDGSLYPEEMTVTPVRDPQGQITHFVAIKLDITERQHTQEKLAKARNELAHANARLEQKVMERTAQLVEANANLQTFAYSAAHDLRSPLRAITGYSAMILGAATAPDPEIRIMVERISMSAIQMSRLLEDLLEYSRMSQADLRLEPVSLAVAMAEVVALLKHDITAKNALVTASEDMPQVIGHPATVVLLLNNLVSNGLKFIPPGVHPKIHVSAQNIGDYVRVSVQDNGIGIPPEHTDKLFTAFQRLHGKQAYPGTGLGLAIVRKGAERMGGRVGVDSTPGSGSRFWIELRAAQNQHSS